YWRRHAQPQERQRALGDDSDGDAQQEKGKQRQKDVGQKFAQQDASMSSAERLCSDDEFAPRQREGCRTRNAHEGGNAEHAENAGEIQERLAEIGGDGQRQDQWWK